jgi:hypothetical protein
MEQLYDTMRLAGYSEEVSQKAANLRGNARLDADLKP